MRPRVLLAHSHLWPNVARLAMIFRDAGFHVDVIAPGPHPVHKMRSPDRTFLYRPTAPRASLMAAITAARPQLLVPCDDRIVGHVHALHAEVAGTDAPDDPFSVSRLIETSLGAPRSYNSLKSRGLLRELDGLPDVHIPRTDPVATLGQLREWLQRHGAPAVLKLDSSWGGRDVIPIRGPGDVASAFFRMQLHRSRLRRIRTAMTSRDPEPVLELVGWRAPPFSVQAFVPGGLANCAVACWRGEILASVAVEVVQRGTDFGNATVVRRVAGEALIAAARSVSRHLELSGMHGFDFVIDADSRKPMLIEINPRATQINHLPLGDGETLATALRLALEGKPRRENFAEPRLGEIALFPQEWERDPNSPYLTSAFHDVPREEPELIKASGFQRIRPNPSEKARRAAAADSGSTRTSQTTIHFRAGDSTNPLFLFPGIGGDLEEIRELANHLRNPSAIVGVGFNSSSVSVDQIAAETVAEILKVQQSGPYNLCGYSYGGVIAFAAAARLREAGREVGHLTLIATPIPRHLWPMPVLMSSLWGRTRRFARRGVRGAAAAIAAKGVRLKHAVERKLGSTAFSETSDDLRVAAQRHYRPGFYPGALTFLQTAYDKEFWCDFGKVWARHAESVDIHTLETSHVGPVRDPAAVRQVAEIIDSQLLERVRTPNPPLKRDDCGAQLAATRLATPNVT